MTQTPLLWSLAVSIALTVSAARAEELVRANPSSVRSSTDTRFIPDEQGVVCGRGRNPTLRLWPTIFSGKIDVFPGDRRSRLISSMTSVARA